MNYSKEEKEAIETLSLKAITSSIEAPNYPNFIAMKKDLIIVLNLIQKQDKIIDKMAEQLAGLAIWNDNIEEALILGDKEEVKEYFKKVVEEDE
jgi:hypothetical protein